MSDLDDHDARNTQHEPIVFVLALLGWGLSLRGSCERDRDRERNQRSASHGKRTQPNAPVHRRRGHDGLWDLAHGVQSVVSVPSSQSGGRSQVPSFAYSQESSPAGASAAQSVVSVPASQISGPSQTPSLAYVQLSAAQSVESVPASHALGSSHCPSFADTQLSARAQSFTSVPTAQ
jgi:hypothetical protein